MPESNLCCTLNTYIVCSYCNFKICRPCYDNTSPGFAHSHTCGMLSSAFEAGRSLPFFCPSIKKVLGSRDEEVPYTMVDDSYNKEANDKIILQIEYLESLKGRDVPRRSRV